MFVMIRFHDDVEDNGGGDLDVSSKGKKAQQKRL